MTSAADASREPTPEPKPPRWPTVRVVWASKGLMEYPSAGYAVQRRRWWLPVWLEQERFSDEAHAINLAKRLAAPPSFTA